MHDMTDDEINKKHKQIRKSDTLRHDRILTTQGERMVEHQCFLAIGHRGYCEFSSACESVEVPNESRAA